MARLFHHPASAVLNSPPMLKERFSSPAAKNPAYERR
jgi:hypothetical protein